jgi:hypothetical protein
MTYVSQGLIQAADYNGFVSTNVGANVNATWNTAYGQPALATVSPAGTITATLWSTLNTTITAMATHQGTTITSRSGPSFGDTIAIQSNLSSDIGNCYNSRWNAAASGSQYTSWTGTASQTSAVGHRNTTWTITFTDTVSFANATAATNFFNAGGLIKIQFSKSSTGAQDDATWNNFVNSICGTIWFSVDGASKTINGTSYTGTTKIGGTGTPSTLLTTTGFNQLTSTPVTIYQQYNTAYVYTGDYVQVLASYNSSTYVLTFTTNWYSPARNVAGTTNEISGGTATSGISFGTAPTTVVTYFPPSTTGPITNTWGTPTVASTVSAPTY